MTSPVSDPRERHRDVALASLICAVVAVPGFTFSPVLSAALVVCAIVLGVIGFRHTTGKAGVIVGVLVLAAGLVVVGLIADQERGARCEDAAATSDPADDCR